MAEEEELRNVTLPNYPMLAITRDRKVGQSAGAVDTVLGSFFCFVAAFLLFDLFSTLLDCIAWGLFILGNSEPPKCPRNDCLASKVSHQIEAR
jgi:hypothetical protein